MKPRSRILRSTATSKPSRGFSLLEVVIAMAILAIALLSISAIHTRGLTAGARASVQHRLTLMAVSRMEELWALPFDSSRLEVPMGEEELISVEWWLGVERGWVAEEALAGSDLTEDTHPIYSLETRVTQYSVDALAADDPILDLAERLPGGTARARVHLKEIRVRTAVLGSRADGARPRGVPRLLGRQFVALRLIKAI